MPQELACLKCRFRAPPGDDWQIVIDPTLGKLTQCPECGSTRVENRPRSSAERPTPT